MDLYPDRSGKVVWTIGHKAPQKPTTDHLDQLNGLIGGIVAWSEPVLKSEDGWNYATLTGYFEDVTKLRVWNNLYKSDIPEDDRSIFMSFALEGDGEECRLVIKCKDDGSLPELHGPDRDPQGQRYSVSISVPGKIINTEGLMYKEGRRAWNLLDDQVIGEAAAGKDDAKEKLQRFRNNMVIQWKGNKLTPEEISAFQKELEAAKERWKTLRREWAEKASPKK